MVVTRTVVDTRTVVITGAVVTTRTVVVTRAVVVTRTTVVVTKTVVVTMTTVVATRTVVVTDGYHMATPTIDPRSHPRSPHSQTTLSRYNSNSTVHNSSSLSLPKIRTNDIYLCVELDDELRNTRASHTTKVYHRVSTIMYHVRALYFKYTTKERSRDNSID